MDKIERKKLKAEYRELWFIVSSAIKKRDPIGLLGLGAPVDEYAPEIGTILPKLDKAASESELCTIIHKEFVNWFGDHTAGPKSAYQNLAQEIWQKYHAKKTFN